MSEENRERFLACAMLADAFQDEATVGLLEDLTGTTLAGGFTRIEYCLDTDGFWLEPHTDIGAKMLTLLIYLSDHPDAGKLGHRHHGRGGERVEGARPAPPITDLVFVPGPDTWHGFVKRPDRGARAVR